MKLVSPDWKNETHGHARKMHSLDLVLFLGLGAIIVTRVATSILIH